MRPRSRTLTAVHDAILNDIVSPSTIVGKHARISNGKKVTKVYLDPLDKEEFEDKIDALTEAYKHLTNKKVTFDFGRPNTFVSQLIEYRKTHPVQA